MGVNDRLFAPPAKDRAKVEARQAAMPLQLRLLLQQANEALIQDDVYRAQRALDAALRLAVDHPDVLRLHGLLLAKVGNFAGAAMQLEKSVLAAPDDALAYWQYARVCEDAGNIEAAFQIRQRAAERLPDSALAWADLGEHLFQYQDAEAALFPLERATRLAPDYAPAQLKYGSSLVACGRAEEGAAAVRQALNAEPAFGAAWLELSDIKTVPITSGEAERMRNLLRGNELDGSERTAVEFALARYCEEAGGFQEAFDLLMDANARRRKELPPWPIEQFRAEVKRAEQVFSGPHASAEDSRLGEQVVFIAGMPRSGTTLVEQILASHHEVQGAGELGEFAKVLTEESTRRRQRYPEWVPDATSGDWHRLGERYLELTARWRVQRPRFTDKMPSNWRAIGAIRAMLPAAHIVICRRDPLENCWSCFKQYFPSGWEFTYDLQHLAEFWRAFDRAATEWTARDPQRVRAQRYEALLENPEAETRALLEFCGLPFDAACLRFHESRRSVHTLSAAQVRRPLQKSASRTIGYGALLDPLRIALGLPPIGTTNQPRQIV